MDSEGFRASQRFKAVSELVLAPAEFVLVQGLGVEALETSDRLSPGAVAARADFRPVALGWRWGPPWSHAWFRLRGQTRVEHAGRRVVLRFSCGTEALLWRRNGAGHEPRMGLDANHDEAIVVERAAAGEGVEALIEATCAHALGTTMFFWDSPESHARWREARPGRLDRAELVVVDEDVRLLRRVLEFARGVAEESGEPGRMIEAIERSLDGVREAVEACDAEDLRRRAGLVRDAIRRRDEEGGSVARAFGVGHAHIDTAWLWTIEETRKKCLRTFSTVLDLMDRNDDFRFLCSQPQQYAWVREDAPALFRRIEARVGEGRWEALGAMWVEPDVNLVSGESLVRQARHGLRFLREAFPAAPRVRMLYLPDTFGFCAALPGVMRSAGLDVFVTNKLWWNERSEFPHVRFRWRGLDGSEVLAHLTPGQDYNAGNTPRELARASRVNARTARDGAPDEGVYLSPFGFGDGGGGPTQGMIESARWAGDAAGLSRMTLDGARAFEAALRRGAGERRPPLVGGELYLERHRGTYTTQAGVKLANARGEAALRRAEWLAAGALVRAGGWRGAWARSVEARLDEAWKLLLLNQFHDILPGSAIGPVYRRAAEDHARVARLAGEVERESRARWVEAMSAPGDGPRGWLVFNPCSTRRSGWARIDGGGGSGGEAWVHAEDVPALGARWAPLEGRVADGPRACVSPAPDGFVLDNGLVRAEVDRLGRVRRLACAGSAGARIEVEPLAGGMNALVLCDDVPRSWEAWDIDEEHLRSERPALERVDRVEHGATGGAAWVEVEGPIGRASRATLRVELRGGRRRLDVLARVEWRESRTLLRVLFPMRGAGASEWTREVAFGHARAPVWAPDSPARAMFEAPGHRWLSVAGSATEGAPALAVLNEAKYGHSCRAIRPIGDGPAGVVAGLTLLRSTKFPDPDADMGTHEIRWAMMTHDGRDEGWRSVRAEGESMTDDLFAVESTLGPAHDEWSPVSIDGDVRVGSLAPWWSAPGGGGGGISLRLVEASGRPGAARVRWGFDVARVARLDALDDEIGAFEGDRVALRAFEFATLGAAGA